MRARVVQWSQSDRNNDTAVHDTTRENQGRAFYDADAHKHLCRASESLPLLLLLDKW